MEQFKKRFWIALVLTLPIVLLSGTIQELLGFQITIPYQGYITLALATVIYVYGGKPFLTGLVDEVKAHQPGMMTLIGMAITVAYLYSASAVLFGFGQEFFWELATLVTIMLLGHWIEAKSVSAASSAVSELVKIMPATAHVFRDGEITDVPVSELKAGDVVLIKPGEKVPSDGRVVSGSSEVNESFITGESKPILKDVGKFVIGGSVNTAGSLKVEIEKTGEETYLAQIIELVKQAQASKSKARGIADRAAGLLFYIAVSIALVTFIVWSIFGDGVLAIKRAVTVLIISCPHALGLAIPLVIALSTTITSRNGIFIRNRTAFERAKDINTVVFDKTGTLTTGKFGVTDMISYIDENEMLSLTGAVERNSEHVIAQAITEYITSKNIEIPEIEGFGAIAGKGARGKVNGREVVVCSPGMLEELGRKNTDEQVKAFMDEGKTVVFTVTGGKIAGVFALSDIVREESAKAVRELHDMGIKTYLLTGDSEEVARSVSEEVGVNGYFAQVLPDKKALKVRELKEQGLVVAMVGDGINDAPALVEADVGIAIGAGTDVAIESADVTLVRSNPADVSMAIFLSKKTHSKIIQNLWWAAGYNIAAIPLAAGILYNQGIIISPAVGAVLMSLSTVIVAINTQTLRKYL